MLDAGMPWRLPGPAGGDLLAGRYRLIDRVGAGGMSVVWRARDELLDRLVAVKWLGAELADDALFRDLVRREAWATARIKHPAVAAVYDYGEVFDGRGALAYVVMEMLDGESLAERLRRGPLAWAEAVAIAAEVADALATAHHQGVVHRDISPDNVMLTSSGIRVFDFGIAARIGEPDDDATGSTFGTPAYVAPERLDGRPAQTATDVYAVGVLLYEMLAGEPPFPEDTWDPDAPLQVRRAPRLRGVAGLPAGVARLVQRCLAHDPDRRPTAREVADRLAAYGRPWLRPRVISAAAALAVIAAVGAGVALSWPPLWSAPTQLAGPPPAGPSVTSAAAAPTQPGSAPTTEAGPTTAARLANPPVTTPPPTAALTPGRAVAELRGVIATGRTDGQIRTDIAEDFDNQVEAIANTVASDQNTDALRQLDSLRANVQARSSLRWGVAPDSAAGQDPSRPAVAPELQAALYAAIDALRGTLA